MCVSHFRDNIYVYTHNEILFDTALPHAHCGYHSLFPKSHPIPITATWLTLFIWRGAHRCTSPRSQGAIAIRFHSTRRLYTSTIPSKIRAHVASRRARDVSTDLKEIVFVVRGFLLHI